MNRSDILHHVLSAMKVADEAGRSHSGDDFEAGVWLGLALAWYQPETAALLKPESSEDFLRAAAHEFAVRLNEEATGGAHSLRKDTPMPDEQTHEFTREAIQRSLAMKPSELVRRGWCQGRTVVGINDLPLNPGDDGVIAWSLTGALLACNAPQGPVYEALQQSPMFGPPLIYEPDFATRMRFPNRTYQQLIDMLASNALPTAPLRRQPNLVAWNDYPGRTQQEVIDLLESVGL